jgi:hypothetical protein
MCSYVSSPDYGTVILTGWANFDLIHIVTSPVAIDKVQVKTLKDPAEPNNFWYIYTHKREYLYHTMNHIITWASDSIGSGFGSSFNSMQSESEKAWNYAKHVVHGNQAKQQLMGDDEGWFTASEHSLDDETESSRDEDDDMPQQRMKPRPTRKKENFRPRFGRQSSQSSMASNNEQNTVSTKSPSKNSYKENSNEELTTTIPVSRNEPDTDERRMIRRCALAKAKCETFWVSQMDSDSDESECNNQNESVKIDSSSIDTKKNRRKKSYAYEYNTDSDEWLSPCKKSANRHSDRSSLNQNELNRSECDRSATHPSSAKLSRYSDKTYRKSSEKNQSRNHFEIDESESERSSSPSKWNNKTHSRKHGKNDQSRNDCGICESESERSSSPAKINKTSSTKKSEKYDSKNDRKVSTSSTEKKRNKKYDLVPSDTLCQRNDSHESYSSKDPKIKSNSPRQSSQTNVQRNDLSVTSQLESNIGRRSTLTHSPWSADLPILIVVPPAKERSLKNQSLFTEGYTPKQTEPSPLDFDLPAPKVPGRTNSSQSSSSNSTSPLSASSSLSSSTPIRSTTGKNIDGVNSPIPGNNCGVTGYKNTVQVNCQKTNVSKEKTIDNTKNNPLNDILKSRRFRSSTLESQKKTNQYTNQNNATTASRKNAKTNRWW